jgi:hypothetical protein
VTDLTLPVRVESTGASSYIDFVDAGTSGGTFRNRVGSSGNDLALWTSATERMRIDSAGNVGIGTSSPAYPLDVSGYLRATDIYVGTLTSDAPGDANTNTGVHIDGGFSSFFSRNDGGNNGPIVANRNNSDGALVAFRRDGVQIGFIGAAASGITFASGGTTERMRITSTGNVGIATTNPTSTLDVSGTGAIKVPVGTTAQRPTPATGQLRFNSQAASFEGYNGSAWGSIGGGASGGGGDQVFYENDQTVTANYTIPADKNAMTTGPININSGVVITVSTGARWVII